MPSDSPSPRPSILIRRPPVPGAANPASADAPAAGRDAPSILHPTIRRYWHRDETAGEFDQPPGQRSGLSGSAGWGAIVAMALIAAALIRQGPGLIEPPPRALAPATGTVAAPLPPPAVPDAELVRGFGTSAIVQGDRMADRAGRAAEDAIRCGRRSRMWVNDAREVLVKDVASRFLPFEEDPAVQRKFQQYLSGRFQYGQQLAAQDFDSRGGQQAICDNLPYSPDYGLLVQAVQQAAFSSQ